MFIKWADEHEGKSCEDFKKFKDGNGVESFLHDNSIGILINHFF
jgi:hypothetical protein